MGCHNINLVSPTPYVREIIGALDKCGSLGIPVVYNTSGYERSETLRMLDGYIDVYLPDFKYITPELSEKYSSAKDYPAAASLSLYEMLRQRGGCVIKDGIMQRGVIVRHLVLPSHRDESVKVLKYLSDNYDKKLFLLSLMSQYTPAYKACGYPELNRRLTSFEYKYVLKAAEAFGFNGFMQERESASCAYTPSFDLTGVKKRQ